MKKCPPAAGGVAARWRLCHRMELCHVSCLFLGYAGWLIWLDGKLGRSLEGLMGLGLWHPTAHVKWWLFMDHFLKPLGGIPSLKIPRYFHGKMCVFFGVIFLGEAPGISSWQQQMTCYLLWKKRSKHGNSMKRMVGLFWRAWVCLYVRFFSLFLELFFGGSDFFFVFLDAFGWGRLTPRICHL